MLKCVVFAYQTAIPLIAAFCVVFNRGYAIPATERHGTYGLTLTASAIGPEAMTFSAAGGPAVPGPNRPKAIPGTPAYHKVSGLLLTSGGGLGRLKHRECNSTGIVEQTNIGSTAYIMGRLGDKAA